VSVKDTIPGKPDEKGKSTFSSKTKRPTNQSPTKAAQVEKSRHIKDPARDTHVKISKQGDTDKEGSKKRLQGKKCTRTLPGKGSGLCLVNERKGWQMCNPENKGT